MAEEQTKPAYQKEFDEFMSSYNNGATNGETVGYCVAKMAHYFGQQNLSVVEARRIYSKKASELESKVDENGKVISSAKAQVQMAATPEADLLRTTEAHLQNIETYINALKSLQRGIQNEYSHLGQT